MIRTGIRRAVCLAAATSLLGALPMTGGYAAERQDPPPTTHFVPSKLDKGRTAEPYVRGKTVYDGKKTLKLEVPHDVWRVQRLKSGYLVQTDDPDSGWGQILYRVGPRGKVTRLHRFGGHVWAVRIDSGGEKVAVQLFGDPNRLVVLDAFADRVLRERSIGANEVLAYHGGRVLLTRGFERSKLSWYRPGRDTTTRIGSVPEWAMFADPEHDVLALRSGEGGGCYDVRRFEAPRTKLWQLCGEEGILAGMWFSPNGKYVLTSEDLHDRPPLEKLSVRRVRDGSVVRTFKARMIGAMSWEDGNTFVMQASADAHAALVRCTVGGDCTRVSALVEARNDQYAIWALKTDFFDLPAA